MGTRANVKIVDENETVWIYRHYDGYPSAVLPDLKGFVEELKENNIVNAEEASSYLLANDNYENTDQQHGDIEFLYTVNVKDRSVSSVSMFIDLDMDDELPL